MTPKSYIEEVDNAYAECRNDRLSRFSDKWDTFSRKINKERLAFTKTLTDENEKSLLNQCLSYWFNRYELLELHSKSKLFGGSKKKRLAKEGKKIREDVLNGIIDTVIGTKGIVEMFSQYHKINPKGSSV